MGNEKHLDPALQQGLNKLAPDLGALSFICGLERFVEQDHAVRSEVIDDGAYSLEFLLQLSASHRRVFLALVMRKQARTKIRAVQSSRHEHAALHHQLR